METQSRSPIVNDEDNIAGEAHCIEPGVQIARMIHEPVACVGDLPDRPIRSGREQDTARRR